ncbi:MAG: 4Fe-4S dicluster domain-containing protein [Kiritimatiellaeota bacterium]|nr:4Fe-4S dicluster domain-containing protein [Kiritimatiellota bacterium]
MIYRTLGKTGLRVSQLGFGAMRLPMTGRGAEAHVDRDLAVRMIRRAFEAGVNYIDTAVNYCNQDSQRVVGEALKGWRDRVIVSTKNHYYGEDEGEWRRLLEDSLERLGVDWIDIYNHHGISWQRYINAVKPRLAKWMRKARDEGLIRHICCSYHDNCENLKRLVDSGYPEVITLQYNLLDRSLEEGIAHAAAKGVAVVVMGPVGGGRLGAPSPVLEAMVPGIRRVPELALRFVLANPDVSVALSGMSTMEQVEENLRTASDPTPLTEQNRTAIAEHLVRLRKLAELYCTGCGYCVPCPAEIGIPDTLSAYNTGRVYGLWNAARTAYRRLLKRPGQKGVDACIDCGKCEEKCPQNIPVRKYLQEAHAALTGDSATPA